MALARESLKVEKKALFCPPLQEVAQVLSKGLTSNFATVSVEVVDCPDLTKQPFTLACKGLNGSPRLIEIGGPPYLLPLVQREKVYELKDIAQIVDVDPAFLIGAGAGPWPYAQTNCEGMYNLHVAKNKVTNQTRISKVNHCDINKPILEILPDSESRVALLANLLCSNGQPGKVLKVHCKKRTGNDDFIASIRKTLAARYHEQVVGMCEHLDKHYLKSLGGTFLLKEGKAKQHVMPDFSTTPINSDDEVNNWLKFYNMSAPLIAVGTLVTGDAGLDLRVQHFHSFSHHGEGGHYHIDTTPDEVEYLGYFTLAEMIYRIDRPEQSHQIGRD